MSLAEFKNKVVLIDFWATWCPPCRMSIPSLVKLNQKYKGKQLVIIGVSLDEKTAPVLPFIKKENVEHLILYGDDSVETNYRIRAIPSFYILDKKGMIQKHYEGYYPGLEQEWEKEINLLLKTSK